MGRLSLVVALAAACAVAIPSHGKYLAIGLGMMALAIGAVAWRARRSALAGAGGMAVGLAAVAVGGTKVALTLAAIDHLGHMFR
jgi:hypothetical protein